MSLIDAFITQARVIFALMIRETRTRFGDNRLGYLWALVEPLVMVATFYLMYWATNTTKVGQMPIFPYLVTGIMPYSVFASVSSRVSVGLPTNSSLLFYPQVTTVDVLLSRALLELATYMLASAIILGGYALSLDPMPPVDNLLMVLAGLIVSCLLGLGWGVIVSSATLVASSFERVVDIIMRPLFWGSGLFFTLNDIPAIARDIVVWNPLIHCTEVFRDGWFPQYTARYLDLSYAMYWAIGMLLVGFALERATRRKLQIA